MSFILMTGHQLADYVDGLEPDDHESVLDRSKIGIQLRCECGAIANSVHFVPWFRPAMKIIPACRDSDPRGYRCDLDTPHGLWREFADWERHLGLKDPEAWLEFEHWLNAR